MTQVQPLNRAQSWEQVSVVVTDDEGIALVHQSYLGSAQPTDVISFVYEPLPGAEQGLHGEVVVNARRAAHEGNQREGIDKEFALYLAHGCHHLSGASDATPQLRSRMRKRELRWLKLAEKDGLLVHLLAERPSS